MTTATDLLQSAVVFGVTAQRELTALHPMKALQSIETAINDLERARTIIEGLVKE